MISIREAIENGRQRGFTKSIEIDGHTVWCDAAIQMHEGVYFVHVSQIADEDMASGQYSVYFTRPCDTLDDAIAMIEKESPIRFDEFTSLPGQQIFRTGMLEGNDDTK